MRKWKSTVHAISSSFHYACMYSCKEKMYTQIYSSAIWCSYRNFTNNLSKISARAFSMWDATLHTKCTQIICRFVELIDTKRLKFEDFFQRGIVGLHFFPTDQFCLPVACGFPPSVYQIILSLSLRKTRSRILIGWSHLDSLHLMSR